MESSIIIFDLDGTLIHSAPDLQAAANAALAELDRQPLDLPTIVSFIGDGVEKLVERSLDATGGSSAATKSKALAAFMDSYTQNMTTLTRPYPGVVDCLEYLKSTGAKLGVCTNKPTGPARDICEQLDLARYFDVIAGAETGQPKKPNARPLLSCIEALGGHADQALYVGDSAVDYETAKNAGVRFHFFTGGYLNTTPPATPVDQKFDDWAAHGIHQAVPKL